MKIKATCNIGTDLLSIPLLEGEEREVDQQTGSRCVALNAAIDVTPAAKPLELKAVPPALELKATPREMTKPHKKNVVGPVVEE